MRSLILILILSALSAGIVLAQNITLNWSPNSSHECAICHFEWVETFIVTQKGTPIAEFPLTKEVSSERMCFSCHDGSVGDSRFIMWGAYGESHKTGTPLKEGMTPPLTLPLVDGKITCMTCHSVHGTGDPNKDSIETSLFLRIPNNESQLCKSCHNEMTGPFSHPLDNMTEAQMHNFKPGGDVKLAEGNRVVCTSCHRPHGAPSGKLLRASGEGMLLCRNCHLDKFPNTTAGAGDDLSIGHLVLLEVDDEKVKENILRTNGRLGPNGELICFSCHTLHKSKGLNLLNMNNTESAFCRSCHYDQDPLLNSPHNMEKVAGYKTVTGQSAMDVGVCSSCHGSHMWQQKMPDIKADQMTRMCCPATHLQV